MDKKLPHAPQQQPLRDYARIVATAALAAESGKLPTRMKILKWGDNPNSQGKKVVVGPKLIAAMAAPTYPYREVALDYEHNTCPGTLEYQRTNEPRPVAAFLSVEVVEGQGVFVNIERWTPDGEKHAQHYRDLSAVPLMNAAGEVIAIISVALSRTGAVPDITFSQAALAAMQADTTPNGEPPKMTHREMLSKLLGLPADSTDEALQQAWEAQQAKAAQAAEDAAALAAAGATAAEDKAGEASADSAAALSAIVKLATRVQQMDARLDGQEKARIIAEAAAEGKVVALSAELIARLSVEDVRQHCKGLPQAVPLAALTPVKVSEGQEVALSAMELEVAQALGLSAEAYAREKKGGK